MPGSSLKVIKEINYQKKKKKSWLCFYESFPAPQILLLHPFLQENKIEGCAWVSAEELLWITEKLVRISSGDSPGIPLEDQFMLSALGFWSPAFPSLGAF